MHRRCQLAGGTHRANLDMLEHRHRDRARVPGPGLRTAAQRLVTGYLFATTTANRVEAGTDVENLAEQRALEKAGFLREGIRRGSLFRDGKWRDMAIYGRLRDDPAPAAGQ